MRIAIVDDLVNERGAIAESPGTGAERPQRPDGICEYANGEAFIQGSRKSSVFPLPSG